MAWQASDLTNIETAIASGQLRVRIDGQEIEYRSMADLLKARQTIQSYLDLENGVPRLRQTLLFS